MKISVVHASRERPKQAYKTAKKWIQMAGIDFSYFISLDNNDPTANELRYLTQSLPLSTLSAGNKSAIEAINHGANFVFKNCRADVCIIVSDDTDCEVNWGVSLLEQLKGKSDFCAKVDDGLQPTLVTMPIMDRVYYERYGYIYNPDYLHMHCDQELTSVAIMTGKYIKLPLSFPHLHYTSGMNDFDDIYAKNNATWTQGETLFNERLKTNFGLKESEIVKHYSSIQWR